MRQRSRVMSRAARAALCLAAAWAQDASAWGDEGHEVIALIAQHYLEPGVAAKVKSLLSKDRTKLTPNRSMAAQATWADKYRESDERTTQKRYNATRQWHFADIAIDSGTLDAACFGFPPLPAGKNAASGPAKDCVVGKINQFVAELSSSATSATERLRALQFLLHFVGDVHQPLHVSNDRDQGGNAKLVSAAGIAAGNLHHYWDTEFVVLLGVDPNTVAKDLLGRISTAQAQAWAAGDATTWALEAHQVGVTAAYALPAPENSRYTLDGQYVARAREAVATQLSKAGVRLGMVLNGALH